MKLFINAGLCERKWNNNVTIKTITEKKQLYMDIPNYLKEKNKQEKIKFQFDLDKISEESFDNDLLLENISLRKTSENNYHIFFSENTTENCIYALIRSSEIVPDDVIIPASMKENVKVIRRIRFIDDEVDYGSFLSNVYLIKISLNCGESLPVYLAYENPKVLEKHYVFYRVDYSTKIKYEVSKKLETFIYINKNNRDEYVSLSEL